ncbi:kinase-like domain-containing protein [Rhizophagus clarus]|uniref:Kinase-like domain-containing protein n=2 Tax=Rhizophagus clarus TaxID=94130 RepID=A0A8H3LK09_9GLOM|nr:kinase-like domain-containing protein [Rhizophagus clarus]
MKECWHEDPVATDIRNRIVYIHNKEWNKITTIVKSSDIGPVTTNNPGAFYKSRPLSGMIQSAMFTMSTRSLRSYSITAEIDLFHKNNTSFNGKRKFDDNQIENKLNEDNIIKRTKLTEKEDNDYITREFELDIDMNISDERYTTHEINFDI